jgi:hypothetical protein
MNLSPNPANDYFNLEITNPHEITEITEKYFIRIVNQYGRVIEEIEVSNYLKGDILSISTSHLLSGLYSVNLYNQHNLISTEKLLITHY